MTPAAAVDRKPSTRRRNAAGSRQALLDAARKLFAERGFDRTTTRDIGDLAGLDPTLISRYFGSKAALYLEALRADFAEEPPGTLGELLSADWMAELLNRAGRRGTGPIYESALRRHPDPAVDTRSREVLTMRFVDPLRRRLAAGSTPDPDLRAELIAAAYIGVLVGRQNGAFPALAAAPSDHIAALLVGALGSLEDGPHIAPDR